MLIGFPSVPYNTLKNKMHCSLLNQHRIKFVACFHAHAVCFLLWGQRTDCVTEQELNCSSFCESFISHVHHHLTKTLVSPILWFTTGKLSMLAKHFTTVTVCRWPRFWFFIEITPWSRAPKSKTGSTITSPPLPRFTYIREVCKEVKAHYDAAHCSQRH